MIFFLHCDRRVYFDGTQLRFNYHHTNAFNTKGKDNGTFMYLL
jgi:hypothetical protein